MVFAPRVMLSPFGIFMLLFQPGTEAAHVFSARSGVVLKNTRLTSSTGPCLEIRDGSSNVLIENVEIGPCAGDGIVVNSSRDVQLRGLNIHDTNGNGVTVESSSAVVLTNSTVTRTSTGVYALNSRRVQVVRNKFLNVRGPMPRGQFVQFNKVKGPGNRIVCNEGRNVAGASAAEDAISVFRSDGDPGDPIEVAGNWIRGGGPSLSGGGILLGDSGGSYQVAHDNILVDPGQFGIGVYGGRNIQIAGNVVYARRQPFTNVGIYVWNQDRAPCHSITVEYNRVDWTNHLGQQNARWTPGNCGTVAGWDTNIWGNTPIPRQLLDNPPSMCFEQ